MNVNWALHIRNKARKSLRRFPEKEQGYIAETLREMKANPFSGDIIKLGEENAWRRRTGNYRVFYEIVSVEKLIYVYKIERRASKTY